MTTINFILLTISQNEKGQLMLYLKQAVKVVCFSDRKAPRNFFSLDLITKIDLTAYF